MITSIRYLECHTKRQGLELKLACTEIGRQLDNERENTIWTLCMFSEERVNIKSWTENEFYSNFILGIIWQNWACLHWIILKNSKTKKSAMHKKKQFILIYSVSVPYVQMLFFISSNSTYHWPVLAVVKENVEFLLVRVIAIAYSYSFLFVVVVVVVFLLLEGSREVSTISQSTHLPSSDIITYSN